MTDGVQLTALAAKVKIETKERKQPQRHRPIGQTVAGVRDVVDGRQVLRRGPRGGYACGRCGKPKAGHVCGMIEGRAVETQIDLDITRGIVKPEDRGGAVMNATARVDAPAASPSARGIVASAMQRGRKDRAVPNWTCTNATHSQ